MNKEGFCIRAYITAILVMAGFFSSMAQTTVTGYVKDSATQTPLSNASIAIKGQRGGARTNADGRFRIPLEKQPLNIIIFIVGYNPFTLPLDSPPEQEPAINHSRKLNELGHRTGRNT